MLNISQAPAQTRLNGRARVQGPLPGHQWLGSAFFQTFSSALWHYVINGELLSAISPASQASRQFNVTVAGICPPDGYRETFIQLNADLIMTKHMDSSNYTFSEMYMMNKSSIDQV